MFNENEKKYLKDLVKRELEKFEDEGDTVLDNMSLSFLAGEAKYEDFLKDLLKKL